MNPHRRLIVATAAGAIAGTAFATTPSAPPDEVRAELPGARLRGAGRLRFLGLNVYDARLWVGERFDPDQWPTQRFVLELAYARDLVGERIAERSIVEMARQRELDDEQRTRWQSAMARVFPDIVAGDRLSGLNDPGQSARFYWNGKARGEIRDAGFAPLFFGI